MPKIRDVLIHMNVDVADRKRKCHRSPKHSISKGETCLVIHGGPYNAGKNYCADCAAPILANAEKKLQLARKDLEL